MRFLFDELSFGVIRFLLSIYPDFLIEKCEGFWELIIMHNVQMSKAITYYLGLINDLCKMLEKHFDPQEITTKKIKRNLLIFKLDLKKYQKNMDLKLKVCII